MNSTPPHNTPPKPRKITEDGRLGLSSGGKKGGSRTGLAKSQGALKGWLARKRKLRKLRVLAMESLKLAEKHGASPAEIAEMKRRLREDLEAVRI